MATGIRKAGDFCWLNMLTTEPDKAMEFFAKVLGWTYFEMPGIGHGMQVDGRNIGGLFDLKGPSCPPDIPPCIGVMVKVDDVDETCERVKALGGSVKRICDIGEQGRMAVCHDPNGANFDIWEAKKMLGTDADSTIHGSPSWSETLTTDVVKATEFYCSLFGWTSEVNAMPGVDYTMFSNQGTGIAGLMAIPHPDIPPHWGTYFTVSDVAEAAQTAKELGGTLFVPPMEIANVGRFCGIISPQGVRFYAIQYHHHTERGS